MATIHLAGSIVLFLFGGVIIIFGLLTLNSVGPLYAIQSSGLLYFGIGVVMIVAGVFVAKMSKS